MSEPAGKFRPWMLLPPLLLLGFLALAWWRIANPGDTEVRSAMIGKSLPQFDLRAALPGKPGLSRADLTDGKPRLLNVFASWCVPCAVEAPQLAALKAQGVEIAGIAIRDRPGDLSAFLTRNGNPFTRIGADDVSAVQLAIGSSGVPETFVVDGKGVIRYQLIGEVRPADVPMLSAKLKEAGQ
jgi:cytochrome c biogenesis protein CcmG, thiol:disulfide interchange protein DsbE